MNRRFTKLGAILLLFVAFSWFVVSTPPLMSFAVAVTTAIAWCRWLEKHTEAVSP